MSNATPAVVDLSAFVSVETATLDILKPGSATPTGWRITFAGPGHAKTIAFNEDKARESLRRVREIEIARINGRPYKPAEQSVSDVQRENVGWIASRILSWTPVNLRHGEKPVEFSEKAAIDLLVDPRFGWVYAQCLEFLTAEQSFMPASAMA